jgi:hypothetical protein
MTLLKPPGKPTGNGSATPVRNVLPLRLNGVTVTQVFVALSYVVVGRVTLGENVIVAFGTAAVKAEEVIDPPVNFNVMGCEVDGMFCNTNTLLNQMVSPAAIEVPLKFD